MISDIARLADRAEAVDVIRDFPLAPALRTRPLWLMLARIALLANRPPGIEPFTDCSNLATSVAGAARGVVARIARRTHGPAIVKRMDAADLSADRAAPRCEVTPSPASLTERFPIRVARDPINSMALRTLDPRLIARVAGLADRSAAVNDRKGKCQLAAIDALPVRLVVLLVAGVADRPIRVMHEPRDAPPSARSATAPLPVSALVALLAIRSMSPGSEIDRSHAAAVAALFHRIVVAARPDRTPVWIAMREGRLATAIRATDHGARTTQACALRTLGSRPDKIPPQAATRAPALTPTAARLDRVGPAHADTIGAADRANRRR